MFEMFSTSRTTFYGILIITIIGLLFLVNLIHNKNGYIRMLEGEKKHLVMLIASSTNSLSNASTTIAALTLELNTLKEQYGLLNDDYSSELGRNEDFEKQIRKISKTVGVLDKLSKTDEELLQKYSKVYFLNEHYIPEKLSSIEKTWMYDESRNHQLHSSVIPYFNEMLEDAKSDGIDLWVVSAYRSFETQAQLKGAYTVTYGSGANTFSADQGFSEHQLGTTIDFTTKGLGGGLNGFEGTPAYTWLRENAHKYGFTLSYPEGNGYYVFEPWHWRFVGEKLADDLQDQNATFYDWEQRKIDAYLVNIFD
ncbi:MAG: D-alanyl-D-alanine carboxypeptidase family protein [Candidatus Pacebacteria bacterium]|nr:D-alanyl-D-alanine carboxypeptidase family protein [Candidatus Paceibacterota bacterium]MBP9843142.1 D-alanyl-D-alanine carboxypeptidase family protein [Candidatus Paceibacterota bacterium]